MEFEIVSQTTDTDDATPKSLTVACPAGKVVLGCFGIITGGEDDVGLTEVQPVQLVNPVTQCRITATNFFPPGTATVTLPVEWSLTGRASCATPQ